MIVWKRVPVVASIYCLLFISLTACQNKNQGTGNGGTDLSADFLGGNGGSGGGGNTADDIFGNAEDAFNSNGTLDSSSLFEQAAESISEMATEGLTQSQIDALISAASYFSGAADAYSGLVDGISPSEVQGLLRELAETKQRAFELARVLERVRLNPLADLLYEEAAKVEILRFFNPQTGKHYYTSAEGNAFGGPIGQFEGVSFRTYRTSGRHGCGLQLYQCARPNGSNYVSQRADCELSQGVLVMSLGFVCGVKSAYAPLMLFRAYQASAQNHLVSLSQPELVNATTNLGYRIEGPLGYSPR